jgi:uncharacterized protein (DUF1778 family)
MPKAKPKSTATGKDTKIQIRLRATQKDLIAQAASLRQTTLSNFLLENGCAAAQQVLADQTQFVLPPDRWEAFCRALDAPPRIRPALKKLLTEASVFDGRDSVLKDIRKSVAD